MKEKVLMNWSGGKDSAMALYNILNNKNYKVEGLLTSVNAANQRISMHGVSGEMLVKQAESIGLPLTKINLPEASDMTAYENIMEQTLSTFTQQGIETSVFGDIFLEDLRKYREQQLEKIGWKAVFPLWKKDTRNLVYEFLELGFRTRICCINKQYLDSDFLGCDLDEYLIDKLPENVDPCGENGEFHTFVYAGPVFQNNLSIKNGERVEKSYNHDGKAYGYEFCDILLEDHQ
ncbi:Dph6-related ATP pyrophosphatase [Elizabethkingia anophelis]|uniref:Dph6-related ATP pyrophosphatase n=1 Tax=Elizabethkingia anophelis TaxID=1117645 RepID=UPI0004030245|nr:diphthine--ammonia ligase [Elizabethkingia anophelis]MCT3746322.1 diphthine--ammonia ligase [Elizabethkingia anophelis]MDC8027507.1 diphthine--ammonia ligase [Elizabethkingia anophelis]MDV3492601.1 ATP-binding protein [Elizabethkingia anophelis]MDV4132132.1 ATP-binding protein [Elizabethkingia anophelis]MDV4135527.1 ATP-binding protein [Elizabethkingia anophelis]